MIYKTHMPRRLACSGRSRRAAGHAETVPSESSAERPATAVAAPVPLMPPPPLPERPLGSI